MRYVLIDDEERAVNLLKILLRRSPYLNDADEILTFTDSVSALQFIKQNGADIVFLDIEMPVLTGLNLARELDSFSPVTIIFVTAYPQYSLNAWETGARGYLLKPYDSGQLNKILKRIHKDAAASGADSSGVSMEKTSVTTSRPHMRCFPDFEMFVAHSPILFKSRKSKELLAFLVYNRGNWVTIDRIVFNLLENGEEISSKNYCRTLTHRLKQTLAKAGCGDILESEYGKLRVDSEKFTCDYYEYLNGKTVLFQGEFLEEYEWAEPAKAAMWHQYRQSVFPEQ